MLSAVQPIWASASARRWRQRAPVAGSGALHRRGGGLDCCLQRGGVLGRQVRLQPGHAVRRRGDRDLPGGRGVVAALLHGDRGDPVQGTLERPPQPRRGQLLGAVEDLRFDPPRDRGGVPPQLVGDHLGPAGVDSALGQRGKGGRQRLDQAHRPGHQCLTGAGGQP